MQNYHKHDSFSNIFTSFKDSHILSECQAYIARAKELGQQVVSTVNHGSQGNYLRIWEAVEKANAALEEGQTPFKYIFGTEAYWVLDRHQQDNANAHIVLLARNEAGRREITVALSEANISGYYYVPRVDMELLTRLTPENVLVTTACVAGWGKVNKEDQSVLWHYGGESNADDVITANILRLLEHFSDSFYLEVQAHDTRWQKTVNEKCLALSYKYRVPLICGLDSHYIYPAQKEERRYLREESGVHMRDEDHEFSDGVYEDYPDEQTVVERFRKQGVLNESEIASAIANTDICLTFEDITFDRARKLPTIYPNLTQEERNALYEKRVWEGWEQYKKNVDPFEEETYEEGIRREIEVVTSTGTSDYFLLDSDMVALAKKKGGVLTPTGRGSGGSFFTNTLLGLSTLDRFDLPVHLYPERFVTADRLKTSLPDLDLNVADPEPFAAAQEELLGEGHVYPMLALGTLRVKSAFKLYARANGMEASLAGEITAQIDRYELALKHADESEQDTILLEDYVEKGYLPYIEASRSYLGIVVSKSQAPCGYLLYNGDIRSEIGVIRVNSKAKNKSVLCTIIDGYTAEAFGYVKNDILTVALVDINQAVMERAGLPSYSSKEILALAENDHATWDIFSKGYTCGINQCGGAATTKKLMQYKPRCLEDLSAFVAAIRPGFKSQLSKFLARERFTYGIPSFDNILQNDTSGSSWLLYQENIMTCLSFAGFTMEETYPIIKAISKKKQEVIAAAKERFLEGFSQYVMAQSGVHEAKAREQSETVWQVIEDSSSYSFNAAHAVAVSIDAIYGAYLKAHHPLEYYTVLLENYAKKGDKDKIAEIKDEMQRAFGIRIAPCRFRQDNRAFAFDKETNTITDTLRSVKNISARVADALYRARDRRFDSFTDVLYWLDEDPAFNARSIYPLIHMGYFEEFGSTPKLLKLFEEYRNGDFAPKKTLVEKSRAQRLDSLRALEHTISDSQTDPAAQLSFEAEYLGAPISIFPNQRRMYVVLSVNDKYSPRLHLYTAANGKTGVAKVKKALYLESPVKEGDIITVSDFTQRPAYRFVDGRREIEPGVKEIWINAYQKLEVPAA